MYDFGKAKTPYITTRDYYLYNNNDVYDYFRRSKSLNRGVVLIGWDRAVRSCPNCQRLGPTHIEVFPFRQY
jgi:hypothetical protein